MQVFITTGTTRFNFNRLIDSVDQSLMKTKKNPQLTIQVNKKYNYVFKSKRETKIINFLSPKQLISHMEKADKIIIHGGPATIFLAVKYAKFIPLIIPRLAKYKEHVDNHQFFFVKYLRKSLPNNIKKYFVIDEKIDISIKNYLIEKNKCNNLNKFLFINKNRYKFAKNLEKYINLK